MNIKTYLNKIMPANKEKELVKNILKKYLINDIYNIVCEYCKSITSFNIGGDWSELNKFNEFFSSKFRTTSYERLFSLNAPGISSNVEDDTKYNVEGDIKYDIKGDNNFKVKGDNKVSKRYNVKDIWIDLKKTILEFEFKVICSWEESKVRYSSDKRCNKNFLLCELEMREIKNVLLLEKFWMNKLTLHGMDGYDFPIKIFFKELKTVFYPHVAVQIKCWSDFQKVIEKSHNIFIDKNSVQGSDHGLSKDNLTAISPVMLNSDQRSTEDLKSGSTKILEQSSESGKDKITESKNNGLRCNTSAAGSKYKSYYKNGASLIISSFINDGKMYNLQSPAFNGAKISKVRISVNGTKNGNASYKISFYDGFKYDDWCFVNYIFD